MSRIGCISCFLVVVVGCQAPPERVPLRPLPEDSLPLPYSELLTRARVQATGATESYYINRWGDLEDYARGLEQTARFLGKATEVPATHKAKLAVAGAASASRSSVYNAVFAPVSTTAKLRAGSYPDVARM